MLFVLCIYLLILIFLFRLRPKRLKLRYAANSFALLVSFANFKQVSDKTPPKETTTPITNWVCILGAFEGAFTNISQTTRRKDIAAAKVCRM